jgi:hypothetical protein
MSVFGDSFAHPVPPKLLKTNTILLAADLHFISASLPEIVP